MSDANGSAAPAETVSPLIDLSGKVAIVTGGSKGIGRAIALSMVRAGASVMIVSRKREALEAVAAEMPDAPIAIFPGNVGDADVAEACVAATLERFGSVDILVNNAATNPFAGESIDIDIARFDKTVQVNLRGPLVWTQAVYRGWMRDHSGSVINLVSIGAFKHESMIGIYNVTKAALVHLTKVLAAELGPAVRVNALCPGLVKTDFARALWEGNEESVGSNLPLRRLGTPSDLAGGALFLASDLASWMTGEVLTIDGGALVAPAPGRRG